MTERRRRRKRDQTESMDLTNQIINVKRTCLDLDDEIQQQHPRQLELEPACCQKRKEGGRTKIAKYNHNNRHHNNSLLMDFEELYKNKQHQHHQHQQQLQQHQQHLQQHHDSNLTDTSRHLVRTLSDLPVFVTIEGYRVASYSDSGESYLCLPQLLQNIKQKFPLEKIIDTFEETVTSFTTATPKQVEGFVKASALPPNADTCPLIKRTDADRVCLRLFDQNHKKICNNIVDLCSYSRPTTSKCDKESRELNTDKSSLEVVASSEHHRNVVVCQRSAKAEVVVVAAAAAKDTNSDGDGNNDDERVRKAATTTDCKSVEKLTPSERQEDHNHLDDDNQQLSTSPESSDEQPIDDSAMIKRESSSSSSSDISDNNLTACSTSNQNNEKPGQRPDIADSKSKLVVVDPKGSSKMLTKNAELKKEHLFESEIQGSILNLARAVTSTLMIQVYHRCFGKCVGLYYPTLVVNSESDCIECSSCHLLLSPRRFVGHTHGVKETSVCHWGFNSYHWRHYIRLSRKQSMNNLDDDELLIQFEKLRTVGDPSGMHTLDECFNPNDMDNNSMKNLCNVDLIEFSSDTTTIECSSRCSESSDIQDTIKATPYEQHSNDHLKMTRAMSHLYNNISEGQIRHSSSSPHSNHHLKSSPAPKWPIENLLSNTSRIFSATRSSTTPTLASSSNHRPQRTSFEQQQQQQHHQHDQQQCQRQPSHYFNNHRQHSQNNHSANTVTPRSLSKSISTYYNLLDRSLNSSTVASKNHSDLLNIISANQLLGASRSSMLPLLPTTSYLNTDISHDLASSRAAAKLSIGGSSGQMPTMETSTELRRDLYVSSSIATYLRSRGVDQDLIKDVVDNTILFLHKSRTIT